MKTTTQIDRKPVPMGHAPGGAVDLDALVDERFLEDLPFVRRHPKWVANESLITVGCWEPLFHRRRTGMAYADDEALFAHEHSEAFVKDVLAVGANMLTSSFEKNHYIDDEELPLKKQLAGYCKKHSLRLAVYIRGDFAFSEGLGEKLRQHDMLGCRADGRVTRYGQQEWRKMTCYHKPAALESYKQSMRRAIVELGVDALHLDGFEIGGMETMGACRCDACRRDFTQFLLRRWSDDPRACKRRFGHTCLEAIEPPGMITLPLAPGGMVIDPVWQEWIRFRCTWSARIAREIGTFVQELNPDVALVVNHGVQAKENMALMIGSDLPSVASCVDVLINESGYHPRITADGRIIQHAREYKMSTRTGCYGWTHVSTYGDTPRKLRQEIAHAAAFNHGRVTAFGHAPGTFEDYRQFFDLKQSQANWLKNHWDHYQNLEDIADVAVWRETKSMAFAAPITFATAMQVEQLLIEDRIPFTVAQGDLPAQAKVVVLPNLVTMDDACCAKVTDFVQAGGSALVIGS
ncbi:MAG: hypothetical protein IT440_09115, partial [Phycisphaeraceae bacterium]|nr:hypothetical protein [Phycisphaeraceae bacterium]